MSEIASVKEWQQQASHFDDKIPFVPWAGILRSVGFKYQYILKDVAIARALDALDIESGSRILDVGCGVGVLLDRVGSTHVTDGFGVDVSSQSLKRARSDSLLDVFASAADARKLPFADNSFDLTISLDVLEHIRGPEQAISEMLRVVRPGRSVLIYAVSSKNKYTFNWFLETISLKFGVDIRTRARHHPELLVDPEMIHLEFMRSGCENTRLELFHSFFTILFDQGLLMLLWLMTRLGLLEEHGLRSQVVGDRVLQLATAISRALITPLEKLDSPWVNRGLSNGFFLIATKRGKERLEEWESGGILSSSHRSQAPVNYDALETTQQPGRARRTLDYKSGRASIR